ncbi:MAG: NAD-dependent epimerase/dehydratase family protein [Clostridia bacterium]|nr:NAD-dependent epimerase/dehydratase family protein [Clostridia bacterium]
MGKIYLLTGAAGFLGSHICDTLLGRGDKVRALVLRGDKSLKYVPSQVEIVEGDLCDVQSLEQFFTVPEGTEAVVIHCASMVTTNPEYSEKLMNINVGGTKNMIEMCLKHSVKKMVYVSSTGAIPELPKGQKIKEVNEFDADSDKVVGWYSKTKAMATQEVLNAVKERGLDACVVHPSGILGPKDFAVGETTRVIIQIMKGEMSAGMGGSFNLCDVRDLAEGCVAAADKGKKGECYILGNEEVTLKQLCKMMKRCAPESKPPKFFLPLWLAYKIARSMEKKAKKTGKKPLMTTFSVYNLARNNSFDYSKAKKELGYKTRPYEDTLKDEVVWLKEHNLV